MTQRNNRCLGTGWIRRRPLQWTRTRIGTWNIKSLNGKEREVIEEMEKYKVNILGLSEIKRKGCGERKLDKGYVLKYSGINIESRAKEGVGFIWDEETEKKCVRWDGINSRIITADFQLEETITIIQIYAPTEDELQNQKESFYDNLNKTFDEAQRRSRHVLIIGDWNAQIGRGRQQKGTIPGIIGNHLNVGNRNRNGKMMLEFCIQNQIRIGNTYFKHKEKEQITYEDLARDVRSTIDFITYTTHTKYAILNVKTIRNAELSTDHYLLIADTRFYIRKEKQNNKNYYKIDIQKLEDPNKKKEYQDLIKLKIEQTKIIEEDLNGKWKLIRENILDAAEKI